MPARDATEDGSKKGPKEASSARERQESVEPWARYRANVARHLIGISRDLETRVIRNLVEEAGFGGLRPSFGPFLSLIWEEGRSLGAIASELAISRQACSQLANLVEAAGYARRTPHPVDGRSKVVSLTAHGRSLVRAGVEIISEIESDYAGQAGTQAYRRFVGTLGELYQGLGLPTHSDPALAATVTESIAVLPLIAVRIQRELMNATIARGHEGLKMSHGQVLPFIGTGGSRISEIARTQGVTRQAISMISQDLEALCYVRRPPDPTDRRGVVLELTAAGQSLIEDSVEALSELESNFRVVVGDRSFENLCATSRELYEALRIEEEIFDRIGDGGPSRDASSSSGVHDEPDPIEALASRLRQRLGSGGAARLAALLDAHARSHDGKRMRRMES